MKKNKSLDEISLLKLLQDIDESSRSYKASNTSELKLDNFFSTTRVKAPIIDVKNKVGTSLTAFPKLTVVTNIKSDLPSSITIINNEETIERSIIDIIEEESKTNELRLTTKPNEILEYDIISEENNIPKEDLKDKCNKLISNKYFKYSVSGLTGLGTGLAMMPIFNYEITELEDFGINIHANKSLFVVSTINTLLVNSVDSAISIYHELNHSSKNELTSKQKSFLKVAAAASILPALLQVSQLWDVELHDKEVSESVGFDEYIAWAIFTTLPLLVSQTLKSVENIRSFIKGTLPNVELDTIGSKAFVYSTTFLSAFGRAIAYTEAIKTLFENLGCEEDFSLGAGIVLGGILGASINGFAEYHSLKSLFVKQNNELSKKEIALGSFCALEGVWFTLPIISEGLDLTKDWGVFLQTLIFFPTFLSRMIHESNSLYHNLNIKNSNIDHNHDIQQPILLLTDTVTDHDIFLVGNDNLEN